MSNIGWTKGVPMLSLEKLEKELDIKLQEIIKLIGDVK